MVAVSSDSPPSTIANGLAPESLLKDRVMPWSDTPVFPLGPLNLMPEDDVLCMVCVSGAHMATAQDSLAMVNRLVTTQGARLWVQFYEVRLHGGIQGGEANGRCPPVPNVGGGGRDLHRCLEATLEALPLPNGRRPTHLVLACDGVGEPPLPAPVLDGVVLPTLVMLPPGTSDEEGRKRRDLWQRGVDGAAHVVWFSETMVQSMEVEIAQGHLRQALREQVEMLAASEPGEPSVTPRPRPRL